MKDYSKYYKEYYKINFGNEFVIHHIDENHENNNIENLLLMPRTLHTAYHVRKAIYQARSGGKLNIGLTYYDSCQRQLDVYEFDKMLEVLQQLQFWIEQKFLADTEYFNAYYMFKE